MPGPGPASRVPFGLAFFALVVYAAVILSIGTHADWRLLHEDNGAFQTSLALSHIRLGLARTRAHDVFFNPGTGEATLYGHHPPGTALILAAVFSATGSASPQIARLVPIAFQLGSLALLVALVSRLFSRESALFGGFLMATLPMGAYFGRMVNYEPLCLFAVLVQLTGYVAFRRNGSRRILAWLATGIVLGGLIDWASFFFAAAIAAAEAIDSIGRRSRSITPLLVIAGAIVAVFLFDLLHLWYAAHGTLAPLRHLFFRDSSGGPPSVGLGRFLGTQFETFRRYLTHAGLLSSAVVFLCLIRPSRRLSNRLFDVPEPCVTRRLLIVTGAAPLAYVIAAPWWAKTHPYWQFYFLPSVILSMVLVFRLLWRGIRERPSLALRALFAALLLEVIVSSACMLRLRHTRPGAYAVRETARLRSNYLSPATPLRRTE
ncbi:MAG TPA: glycosyltransferase family 39 protein [Thermoanaerobaculia bacterium]